MTITNANVSHQRAETHTHTQAFSRKSSTGRDDTDQPHMRECI